MTDLTMEEMQRYVLYYMLYNNLKQSCQCEMRKDGAFCCNCGKPECPGCGECICYGPQWPETHGGPGSTNNYYNNGNYGPGYDHPGYGGQYHDGNTGQWLSNNPQFNNNNPNVPNRNKFGAGMMNNGPAGGMKPNNMVFNGPMRNNNAGPMAGPMNNGPMNNGPINNGPMGMNGAPVAGNGPMGNNPAFYNGPMNRNAGVNGGNFEGNRGGFNQYGLWN